MAMTDDKQGKSFEGESPLELADLLQLHDTVATNFSAKWEEGEKNENRMLAQNWTEDEEAKIKDQDRQPYSFPINASYLQRISATQKKARQGWEVKASVDPNDEVKAEVADLMLKDFERQNKLKYIESEVFDDGIGPSFGVDKLEVVYDKGYPQVINKKVDWRDVVWDYNDTTYDLSETLFVAEIEKKYKFEMESEGYDVTSAADTTSGLIGRSKQDYYAVQNGPGEADAFTIVSVFHHFQRVYRDFHYVVFKDSQRVLDKPDMVVATFESKKEANEFLDKLKMSYLTKGFPWKDENGEEEGSVVTKTEVRYDYYKFFYNKLLDYQKTNLKHHPYNFYFSIKVANRWISLMQFMESPQLFMDRLWTQVDYSFQKELKTVLELNVNALADGETKESAIRKASKTGGIVATKSMESAFNPVQMQGVNPQYIQTINIMTEYMTQAYGGANFQGNRESAAESGKAVQLRQQQGSLVASLFLDNLAKYKQLKGEKVLYYMQKFDTSQRVIRVMGGDLEQEQMQLLQAEGIYTTSKKDQHSGYLTLNKPGAGVSFLKNAEFELTVSEVPMTDSQKQAKLLEALEAEKVDPTLQQLSGWNMYKIGLVNIPASERMRLLEEYKQNLQSSAEAAQRAEEREQQKLNIDQEKVNVDKAKVLVEQEKVKIGTIQYQMDNKRNGEEKKAETKK